MYGVWKKSVPDYILQYGETGGRDVRLRSAESGGEGHWSSYRLMIHIIIADKLVLKVDEETSKTWLLNDDDEGYPLWVEIKNEEPEEK
jgi:hypothetical protein